MGGNMWRVYWRLAAGYREGVVLTKLVSVSLLSNVGSRNGGECRRCVVIRRWARFWLTDTDWACTLLLVTGLRAGYPQKCLSFPLLAKKSRERIKNFTRHLENFTEPKTTKILNFPDWELNWGHSAHSPAPRPLDHTSRWNFVFSKIPQSVEIRP